MIVKLIVEQTTVEEIHIITELDPAETEQFNSLPAFQRDEWMKRKALRMANEGDGTKAPISQHLSFQGYGTVP